jgi:transposase
MFYCGIDLASKTTALCVVNEQDKVICERETATDLERIARQLQPFRRVLCLVEAAPLAEWCKRGLEAHGIECQIIDTRRAQKLFDSRKKTDQRDARTLARMARVQWYNVVHAKSEQARLLRTRLGVRKGLVSMLVGVQNQVRGFLRAHGERVTGASGTRFSARIREEFAGQPQLLERVEPLLRVWETVRRELVVEDKALRRVARENPDAKRLMRVPGVAQVVSLAFMATIDTPKRFTNAGQVGDYVGLAPGIYQSGETERRGRITREGDSMLRALLVEAANNILYRYRGSWAWKRWAQALSERRGPAKARVALARRLAGLLWRLWNDETPFELRTA